MLRSLRLALLPISLLALPATADGLRDFCADRPGLGTPTCIADKGHVYVEGGIVDWTREDSGPTRTDTLTFSDVLVRYGVTDTLEARVEWDSYGIQRNKDRATGVSNRESGSGDTTFSVRQSLRNPDGSGFSAAVVPYITAPTGAEGIGAGDWAGGIIAPVSFELVKSAVTFSLSPAIAANVDADGKGRHPTYGSVASLVVTLRKSLSASIEGSVFRDDDPSGHTTTALAGLAFGWQANDNLQFDVGTIVGLDTSSPDFELYTGFSRRF
jgi:hypothetical protein